MNDSIITSLEVNTVSTETSAYRLKNKPFCPALFLASAIFANLPKNPASSRNTDSAVIDKNSTSIFKGFTSLSAISADHTVFTFVGELKKTAAAPISVISQYVFNFSLPILSFGKNSTEAIIAAHTATAIIIGASISLISF